MLLRALTQGRSETVVESGDLGTYDELVERIDEFKPHVVHLSGQAQDDEEKGEETRAHAGTTR